MAESSHLQSLGLDDEDPGSRRQATKGRRAQQGLSKPKIAPPISRSQLLQSSDESDDGLNLPGKKKNISAPIGDSMRKSIDNDNNNNNTPDPVPTVSSPIVSSPKIISSQQRSLPTSTNQSDSRLRNMQTDIDSLTSQLRESNDSKTRLEEDIKREIEERTWKLEHDKTKLTDDNLHKEEIIKRLQRDLESARTESEESRVAHVKTQQESLKLQNAFGEASELRREVSEMREAAKENEEKLENERRKVSQLTQAQTDPNILPYTPPPRMANVSKDVPADAPLSFQIQVMLYNSTKEIVEYQKTREEAIIQSMRSEQQRWQSEMVEREDIRNRIQQEELQKWRTRDQEERLERESRDSEERILRQQRTEQERTDAEILHRKEKSNIIQQEMRDREVWSARLHDEHQNTIERITVGFTTTQEQTTRSHEIQIRTIQSQIEEEKKHNRRIATQQSDEMRLRYEHIIQQQEQQHKEAVSSLAGFKESLLKLTSCELEISKVLQQQKDVHRSVESQWGIIKTERDSALADREVIIEELRKSVAEKHQALDSERVMLSRLLADFRVSVDGIKRSQEDERSRLTAAVTRAEKSKEDYEREHRKWMRESVKHKIELESGHQDGVDKLVAAAEDLKAERSCLSQERRDFQRSKESHLQMLADQEQKLQQQRSNHDKTTSELQSREDNIKETERRLTSELDELNRQGRILAEEKDGLKDELYRIKELGNIAFQKSNELQKMRDDLRLEYETAERSIKQSAETEKIKHTERTQAAASREIQKPNPDVSWQREMQHRLRSLEQQSDQNGSHRRQVGSIMSQELFLEQTRKRNTTLEQPPPKIRSPVVETAATKHPSLKTSEFDALKGQWGTLLKLSDDSRSSSSEFNPPAGILRITPSTTSRPDTNYHSSQYTSSSPMS